jgi:predicted transcriptional regulator
VASRLTSVRFDEDTLDQLRLVAEVNDTNIAAEVREAVRRYLAEQLEAADFEARLDEAHARQRATMQQFVSSLGRQNSKS